MRLIQFTRFFVTAAAAAALALSFGCSTETESDLVASAKQKLEKRDSKAAIVQLKAALALNPQSGEARYLLGKALMEAGNAGAAVLELNKATELRYTGSDLLPALARAMLEAGQHKKIIELYSQTTLPDAGAVADLKTSLATALLRQGSREEAEAALEAALSAAADFAPALNVKARIKASQDDFDGALKIADGILAKNPRDYLAWNIKGDISMFGKRGKPDKAAAMLAYRKALESEPRFLPGYEVIMTVLLQDKDIEGYKAQLDALRKALPGHPELRYFEAQLALVERDTKKARELLQQLLRSAPNDMRLLQLAALIEYQSQAMGQAETYLNKALQVTPGSAFARRLLAQVHLQNGQSEKALATLAPLLANGGGDAETLALAAEAELVAGNEALAEQYYLRATRLSPTDVKIRTAAALARLTTGDAGAVFAELEAIAANDSGTGADLALISARLRKKEYEGALLAIDALDRKAPNKPLTHYLRGRVLLAQKNVAAARASFERALVIFPSYLRAAASLAALDVSENKLESARLRFEGVLKTDPKNGWALLALADIKARAGAAPQEVEELIRNAIAAVPNDAAPRVLLVGHLLAQRRFKDALAAAQDATAVLPDNQKILDALAQAQLKSGDSQQAINTYRRLAAANPKSPEPVLRLAAAYLASKNRQAAAQSFRRALEIRPDLELAQASLIALAIDDKRFDDATQLARVMQKQRATQAVGWVYEGDIKFAQKSFDASAAAFRTAFAKEKAADIAIKLYRTLGLGGHAAEANRFVAEMDKASPRDGIFQLYLGDAALLRGDFAAAEIRYRAVTAVAPRNAIAFNNLAFAIVKQNKAGAVAIAEKANEILPGKPVLLDTLATALAADREFSRAISTQRKVIELEPANGNWRLNLARIHILAGEKAQAQKELETLRLLGGSFKAQAEVTQLLQSLQ